MTETKEETELRERALTLLLIERDQVAEKLALLDYPEKKAAPVKRGKRSKPPVTVGPLCTNREAVS